MWWIKQQFSPFQGKALYLSLFLLLFSSLLAYAYQGQTQHDLNPLLSAPEEYMHQIELISFDDFGECKEKLVAKTWRYSADTAHSILQEPVLQIYQAKAAPFEIMANSAEVTHPSLSQIETIHLSQVHLKQISQEAPHATLVQLETSHLDYSPNTRYAETQGFVKMSKPSLTMTGVGLRAFLNQNWLELLHDVKTQYHFLP